MKKAKAEKEIYALLFPLEKLAHAAFNDPIILFNLLMPLRR
jgi:hypothetical protein